MPRRRHLSRSRVRSPDPRPDAAAIDRSTAADADSASFDDADERRRELRRLFRAGRCTWTSAQRVYPMSTDDDNLEGPTLVEPKAKRKATNRRRDR